MGLLRDWEALFYYTGNSGFSLYIFCNNFMKSFLIDINDFRVSETLLGLPAHYWGRALTLIIIDYTKKHNISAEDLKNIIG